MKLVEFRLVEGARWSTQLGRVWFQEPRASAGTRGETLDVDGKRRRQQPRVSWLLEYLSPTGTHWIACKPEDEFMPNRRYRLRRGVETLQFRSVLAGAGAQRRSHGARPG